MYVFISLSWYTHCTFPVTTILVPYQLPDASSKRENQGYRSFPCWKREPYKSSPKEREASAGHHFIQKGLRVIISLDLLHAYLHAPIHPSLGKFLFYFVLFSLAVSPRVFTRVVVTCVRFLDDWLLRNQQVDHLMAHAQSLLYVTARLSCIPSLEKLTPIQDFVFIDTHYRSNLGWMFLPEAGSEKQPVKFVKSPGKVCYSWEISLAVGETGVNIRSCAPGLSQVSASSALHISSLASQ